MFIKIRSGLVLQNLFFFLENSSDFVLLKAVLHSAMFRVPFSQQFKLCVAVL